MTKSIYSSHDYDRDIYDNYVDYSMNEEKPRKRKNAQTQALYAPLGQSLQPDNFRLNTEKLTSGMLSN